MYAISNFPLSKYNINTYYSKISFIGTLIYRDIYLSGSRNLIYLDILFLLQPPLLVHSDMKWGKVKAWWDSHHETEGGSGEPLNFPINEEFTF